jgi:hypothetical protein
MAEKRVKVLESGQLDDYDTNSIRYHLIRIDGHNDDVRVLVLVNPVVGSMTAVHVAI